MINSYTCDELLYYTSGWLSVVKKRKRRVKSELYLKKSHASGGQMNESKQNIKVKKYGGRKYTVKILIQW